MLTLHRAAQRGGAGRTIPMPYRGLQDLDFSLQVGQVSMLVAAPGVGKSTIALDVCMKSGLDVQYFCGDTDAGTMVVRATAKVTGYAQSVVREQLKAEEPAFTEALWNYSNVRFVFDATDTTDIHDEVLAFALCSGKWPDIIVVDNLADIVQSDGGEFTGTRQALQELGLLARNTNAHVMVLHHAQGVYDNGDKPIPLSGLEQKVSKKPAQVLTFYRKGNALAACPVKNRQGKADPTAGLETLLHADLATMQINDWPEGIGYGH
jgi:replicative DNA helicase